jgi:flavin reductase (DIM6/NTAB) family NADH-FMN oxidoreductase RutF
MVHRFGRILLSSFVLLHSFPCTSTLAAPPIPTTTTSSSIPPPPPISMPVWSLACPSTSGNDGAETTTTTALTSMNIMTFCTPVSISPRLWALALYYDTRTKDSFLENGKGILQLLTRDHAHELIPILGKQSGYKVNKEELCRNVGIPWKATKSTTCDVVDGEESTTSTTISQQQQQQHVLPRCATYLEMTVQSTMDAGDHLVVICQLTHTGRWNEEHDELEWLTTTTATTTDPPMPLDDSEVLSTGWLRDQGIL